MRLLSNLGYSDSYSHQTLPFQLKSITIFSDQKNIRTSNCLFLIERSSSISLFDEKPGLNLSRIWRLRKRPKTLESCLKHVNSPYLLKSDRSNNRKGVRYFTLPINVQRRLNILIRIYLLSSTIWTGLTNIFDSGFKI